MCICTCACWYQKKTGLNREDFTTVRCIQYSIDLYRRKTPDSEGTKTEGCKMENADSFV